MKEEGVEGVRLRICHDGQTALPVLCECGSPGAAMFYFFHLSVGSTIWWARYPSTATARYPGSR